MTRWNFDVLKLPPVWAVTILVGVGQALGAAPRRIGNPVEYLQPHLVEYGTASWYGPGAQGRLMACGEPFNENALTAAHRSLPLGTRVKVTNLRNGRSVIVRIRDRGPAIRSRLIDLSREAARELGFIHRGLTPVKVQVVSLPRLPRHSPHPAANPEEAQLHVGAGRP